MPRAIDDAQQITLALDAKDVEVAADDAARLPDHEEAFAQHLPQLLVGQDGTLNQAGVIERIVDLLVRQPHLLIGRLQRLRPGADAAFELCRVAADLAGHDREGPAQITQFVAARRRQRNVEVALRHRRSRLLQLAQRAQHQLVDGVAEGQQQNRHDRRQRRQRRIAPVLVEHLGGLQIDGRNDVPFELGNIRQRQQLRLAVERDAQRADLAGALNGALHRLRQAVALLAFRQLPGQRLIDAGRTAGLVDRDQLAVAVRLNGAGLVDDDRRHASGGGRHEFGEETGEVDAGAGHADLARVVIADGDVDPDPGDLQMIVVIDIDVVVLGPGQRTEKPGIFALGRIQRVARQIAGRLVAVAGVIIPRQRADNEVGVIAQVLAVALGFLEEQRFLGRIALVEQPLAGQHRTRQTAR